MLGKQLSAAAGREMDENETKEAKQLKLLTLGPKSRAKRQQNSL